MLDILHKRVQTSTITFYISKILYVCYTTGPIMLSDSLNSYLGKDYYLLPQKLFNPCTTCGCKNTKDAALAAGI